MRAVLIGRVARSTTGLVVPAVVLVVWQLAGSSGRGTSRGVTPTGIGAALIGLARSGALGQAMLATGQRVALGFVLALGLALAVATLLVTVRPFERLVDPVLEILRPLAPIAWVPLAMFWFGATEKAAVFIVAYAAFFPIVTNVAAGIRQVDPVFVEAARTLGARPLRTVGEVLLPGALPLTIAGARLGLGTAWAAVIAAELTIGATSGVNSIGGLGQAMYSSFLYDSRLEPILALICVVGAVAFAMNESLRRLERRLTPWVGQ